MAGTFRIPEVPMFRSLLVPLDGSAMAEQAIVPAGDIARRLGASLALAVVHPWGATEDAPFAGTEADRELRANENRYLSEVRDRVAGTFTVPADVALLEGDAVPALAAFAGERRVDLVVSSTHGRALSARCAARWRSGSPAVACLPCSCLRVSTTPTGRLRPDPAPSTDRRSPRPASSRALSQPPANPGTSPGRLPFEGAACLTTPDASQYLNGPPSGWSGAGFWWSAVWSPGRARKRRS
jgi:nucleotide-binding universal stress UspA family protein